VLKKPMLIKDDNHIFIWCEEGRWFYHGISSNRTIVSGLIQVNENAKLLSQLNASLQQFHDEYDQKTMFALTIKDPSYINEMRFCLTEESALHKSIGLIELMTALDAKEIEFLIIDFIMGGIPKSFLVNVSNVIFILEILNKEKPALIPIFIDWIGMDLKNFILPSSKQFLLQLSKQPVSIQTQLLRCLPDGYLFNLLPSHAGLFKFPSYLERFPQIDQVLLISKFGGQARLVEKYPDSVILKQKI
jgi:hypothetical protein